MINDKLLPQQVGFVLNVVFNIENGYDLFFFLEKMDGY